MNLPDPADLAAWNSGIARARLDYLTRDIDTDYPPRTTNQPKEPTMTEHEQRRADRIATGWRYDAGLEQQAQLLRDDPAEHDRIFGGGGTIALGLYLDGKAAARAAGIDTTKEN